MKDSEKAKWWAHVKPTCVHGLEKCAKCDAYYNGEPMNLDFLIYDPSEDPIKRAAGIVCRSDQVTVTVESGNPGREPGEFEKAFKEFLSQWYDGAHVMGPVYLRIGLPSTRIESP